MIRFSALRLRDLFPPLFDQPAPPCPLTRHSYAHLTPFLGGTTPHHTATPHPTPPPHHSPTIPPPHHPTTTPLHHHIRSSGGADCVLWFAWVIPQDVHVVWSRSGLRYPAGCARHEWRHPHRRSSPKLFRFISSHPTPPHPIPSHFIPAEVYATLPHNHPTPSHPIPSHHAGAASMRSPAIQSASHWPDAAMLLDAKSKHTTSH